jgi:hypothetical protein
MKQKTKRVLKIWLLAGALFCFGFIVAPQPTHAAVNSILSGQICEPDNSTGGSAYNIARCVNNIYTFGVAVGGFVAVLMFVIAGYFYAQGGNENISKAKGYINSTIIGLVLLFGTYALLNTIDPNLTRIPKIELPNGCYQDNLVTLKLNPTANTLDATKAGQVNTCDGAYDPNTGNGVDSNGNATTGSVKGVTKSSAGIPAVWEVLR